MFHLLGVWFISLVLSGDATTAPRNATLVAYDCTDQSAHQTVIDLTAIKPCAPPRVPDVAEESTHVVVLQSKQYRPVDVRTCLVKYSRSIFRCGMHSHLSAVPNGVAERILTLGAEQCRTLHTARTFMFSGAKISGLEIGINIRSVTLTGEVGNDGTCQGATFSDSFGGYYNVVVMAKFTITLHAFVATATLTDEKILLGRTGLVCHLHSEYCADDEYGEAVWTYREGPECVDTRVDTLYSGDGVLTQADDGTRLLVIKQVPSTFALRITGSGTLCGQVVFTTEHSRVYVAKVPESHSIWGKAGQLYTKNVDWALYIGSKFLFVTHMVYTNMQQLATDFLFRECQLRRMVLENRLLMATVSPNSVSQLAEGPGVYGRVQGEVLYIVKCHPTFVSLRYTENCYQELPVIHQGRPMFRAPTTHMLTPDGTEVPCKSMLYPRFKLGSSWYIRTPDLVQVAPPVQLDPNRNLTWNYEPIVGAAVGGLYSDTQLTSLQREMMFPTVREAISNNMIRKVTGSGGTSFDPTKLWSPTQIGELADTLGGRISWFFGIFGHYASIILGLYFLYRIGIYLVGICVNCYVLRKHGYRGCRLSYSLVDACTLMKAMEPESCPEESETSSGPGRRGPLVAVTASE